MIHLNRKNFATIVFCSCFTSLFAADLTAAQISVGFSPSGNALANVLNAINSANHNIDIAAYSFTSKEIGQALVQAAQRGVHVRVVADQKDNQNSKYSDIIMMQQNNIPVRLDGHYAIMHNKFMVVDGDTTETGSFNFTTSADKRNAENALVIWNDPQLASTYEAEFERLWQESSAPGTNNTGKVTPDSHYSTTKSLVRNLMHLY